MAIQELGPTRINNDPFKNGGERTPSAPLSGFFDLFAELYKIKRQGWIKRGIKNPESVADHSLEVAIGVMPEASLKGLNIGRAIGMAFVHDLPEIISGDPTPYDQIPDEDLSDALQKWIPPSEEALEQKRRLDHEALMRVTKFLPRSLRKEIRSLWQEYEEGVTEEAKLVRQVDRRQRLAKAKWYRESEGAGFPIAAFLEEARQSDDPELRRQADEIQEGIKRPGGLLDILRTFLTRPPQKGGA